jgi:hypothetical protein
MRFLDQGRYLDQIERFLLADFFSLYARLK